MSTFIETIRREAERRARKGEKDCSARYSPSEFESMVQYHERLLADELLGMLADCFPEFVEDTP